MKKLATLAIVVAGLAFGLAGCMGSVETDTSVDAVAEASAPDLGIHNGGPDGGMLHCGDASDCPSDPPVCAMWLCDPAGPGDGTALAGCYLEYAPAGEPCPVGSGTCSYPSAPAIGPGPRHVVGVCIP